MDTIVMKFGGSSVATVEKLEKVAEHIIDEIGSDEDISSDPKFSMILDMLGYE